MRITNVAIKGLLSTTIKAFLLANLVLAISIVPALQNEARAGKEIDKSSPKIAHGMYRDRGKSSPKIAHGMYRDRGKSSPKIAHGMYRDRGKSSPKIAHRNLSIMEENIAGRTDRDNLDEAIFMALELGELELANELLYELNTLERVGR